MAVCMNPRGDKRFPGCGRPLPPGGLGLCARCGTTAGYVQVRCRNCGSEDRERAPKGCVSHFHASNREKKR